MLCEQGKLRLADPVSRYLPEFKDARVMVAHPDGSYDLVPARREVTVHDLLTHSGGLSYGSDDHSALDKLYRETLRYLDNEVEPVLEKWMQAFAHARLPLAFQPGTDFRYSFSIDLLGYIVQFALRAAVRGFPPGTHLRSAWHGRHSLLGAPPKAPGLAIIYTPCSGGGLEPVEPFGDVITQPTRKPFGGGGLVSTAGDYFRFGQMLLNGGELDGVRLLGRKTVEWMLQNHLPEGVHPMGELANGFGLGGAVLLHPGLSHRPGSPGRFGWGGAANTEWWIDPAEQLNCLLMLQYMPCFTIPIVEDFAQLVYQALS